MNRKRPRWLRIARVRVRRTLARVERTTPVWALLILTPWGVSLALHGLGLLMMGLFFYASTAKDGGPTLQAAFASQLTDDLTSMEPGDRAGDSFTTLDSDLPPSLVLDPSQVDPDRINVPELGPQIELGPEIEMSGIMSPLDPRAAEGNPGPGMRVGPGSAPFSGRQGEAKAKLVRREGGTVESEQAVERGLDWLARHQRPDGGWSLDTTGQCTGDGCPADAATESDTAATGLALLPMLGAGMSHKEPGRYQETIKRGFNWLIQAQKADGDLFVGGSRNAWFYSQAIGAMALCEGYGVSKDKRLRDPAQKAIHFILRSQNRFDGGWRYFPGAPGDTSVFGWQLFALRSARLAGLDVSKESIRLCRVYLDLAAADSYRTTYAYMPGREVSPVMTAEALLGRQILGWSRNDPAMIKGSMLVSAHLAESQERNIYYWYYATQMLHNLQGEPWVAWNTRVRDGLVGIQAGGKGCDRGSWDPINPVPDRWGRSAGRLFETSLSLLTLEVYYRYLPLYQPTEKAIEGTESMVQEDDVKRAEGRGQMTDDGWSAQGANWAWVTFL